MKPNPKVQEVAHEILDAFERGDVPKALAQVFIRRHIDIPCRKWSWRNRAIAILRGHHDARGFRQWKQVGRTVKKGERAFYILAPCTRKATKDDPANGIKKGDLVPYAFRRIPVFGYRQTEGRPLPDSEREAEFIDTLPLVDVARRWGIKVETFDVLGGTRIADFNHAQRRIGLGVRNLASWAHEMIHAADHRLGSATKGTGQQLDNEVVAEFGGAVLLECLGHTSDSDRGGAFDYIQTYAREHDRDPVTVCSQLLERTCRCVSEILDAADAVERAAA